MESDPISHRNLTAMLMSRFMSESSILFENALINKVNIEYDSIPFVEEYFEKMKVIVHWNIFRTSEWLEYDRLSTLKVEKFTLCKFSKFLQLHFETKKL